MAEITVSSQADILYEGFVDYKGPKDKHFKCYFAQLLPKKLILKDEPFLSPRSIYIQSGKYGKGKSNDKRKVYEFYMDGMTGRHRFKVNVLSKRKAWLEYMKIADEISPLHRLPSGIDVQPQLPPWIKEMPPLLPPGRPQLPPRRDLEEMPPPLPPGREKMPPPLPPRREKMPPPLPPGKEKMPPSLPPGREEMPPPLQPKPRKPLSLSAPVTYGGSIDAKKKGHEDYDRPKNPPVSEMLAKLEKAKVNNEALKVSHTTILFTGSSGVGKTNLMKKLNKESLNPHHHSTGVVESKHTICVKTTAVVKSTEGLQWTNLDYDSMIAHLNKYLQKLRFPKENPSSDLDHESCSRQDSFSSSPTSSSQDKKPKNEEAIKINKEVETDIAKADSTNTPSLGDVWDIINFLDTGGQPEFVNILPMISSSIAITFIVFNLSKNLDSLVHVQHNVKGHPSFEPYFLDCTNLEFIKRLMVSSENFNKNIMPPLKGIPRKDGGNDSKICYVGTHAFNISEEELQKVDCKLSSIANELGLHQRSFWSSPNPYLKRLFPTELFGGNEEFEDIIEGVRDNIQNQVQWQDYYDVPITWFIFLLKLQKLSQGKKISYISYQEAVDEWMDKQVGENINNEMVRKLDKGEREDTCRENSDVHNILLFFHFMGMLFYYHEVEGICDYVFIDRQWLFEKLTELVELKFTKNYRKQYICAEDLEKFTMEGKLNVSIIENLKINLQGIQPLYFIYLLNHLNIIAPIDQNEKDYFMPCVLPSFSLETQKLYNLEDFYGAIQHAPLLVGFRNGPIPHGFFCHLIVELFRNLPAGWTPPLLSTEEVQHAYNNLITFLTTCGHAISLFYKIGYLEIQIRRNQSCLTTIHCNVQYELVKALHKVANNLQLNREQLCYGFYCNCKRFQHFAKLKELTIPTEYIFCGYSHTELTDDHRVWLQMAVAKTVARAAEPHVNEKEWEEYASKESEIDAKKASTATPVAQMKPKLQEILEWVAPYVTDKWEKIFVQLLGDEHRHVMTTIRRDYHRSEEACQIMFEQWLDLCPNPSWSDLISALRANSVRKIALAEELVKRIAKLSGAPPAPPTQPPLVSPKQQHDRARGPDQLVVKGKEPEEKCEGRQSVEATDGGTNEPGIAPQAALTKDCGKGTVLDAVFTEVKRAVCRIHAPQTVGTGFIGYTKCEDKYITVLVTANHVIPVFEDAKASRITFENLLPDNKKLVLKGFEIFTGKFWFSPPRERDYSIMEVDDSKIIEYDIQPIHLSQPANIKNGDQVYVIQHPRGGSLAFSSSDSTVKSPFLYYKCTTEKGSSGSPVLKEVDGELKIVALHRGTTECNQNLAEHNCGTLIKEIQLD